MEIFLLCRLGAELPAEGTGLAISNNRKGGRQLQEQYREIGELNSIGAIG